MLWLHVPPGGETRAHAQQDNQGVRTFAHSRFRSYFNDVHTTQGIAPRQAPVETQSLVKIIIGSRVVGISELAFQRFERFRYGLEALMGKYGVDVYLCGHEHNCTYYEYTWCYTTAANY